MPTTNERRRKQRVSVDLDMRCELSGRSGSARIRDISASGVRCITQRALPLMTQVELVIQLPSDGDRREIVCRGAVVRSGPRAAAEKKAAGDGRPQGERSSSTDAPEYETAIFFTQVKDADRMQIEEFVSSKSRSA